MSTPTAQQSAAIAARGNVLVAAGAGTGKTSTVARRCVELVLQEKCELRQILMVTFTDAAAAEMRERIRRELRERLESDQLAAEDRRRLAEQMALLESAPISTLHGFCLELVRRNFHVLGLDPQFTVLDEQQTQPLIHTVLDEMFERHYSNLSADSEPVRNLVRQYGNGHDTGIRELVLKIHRHAQTLPQPAVWMGNQLAAFQQKSPDGWRKLFLESFVEWARLWSNALEPMTSEASNLARCRTALLDVAGNDLTLKQASDVLEDILQAGENWPDNMKTKLRKPVEAMFSDAQFLRQLARDNGAALAEDWAGVREYMVVVLQLAQEFAREFARAKRELGGLDFSDQEQFALQLLYDERGRPSVIAQNCRREYRFVFVDECQDINAAQDAILRAVSGEGPDANRFLVGDVKQSIYRFRLADPRIFQEYEMRWKQKVADGRCQPLTENFRAREALLHFINPLFRALMHPIIGGLNYDADAELRFGNPAGRAELAIAADPENSPRVELCVITKQNEAENGDDASANNGDADEAAELQSTEREARLIATRLKQLKESGHLVWRPERRKFEPVNYGDMVVLMRGVGGRAEVFAKAFHQVGVPLHAARAGFFETVEVTDLLNLLRLLDNPLQDVPLLAVLCSPLVGLSPVELVQVRLTNKKSLFWFALREFVTKKSEGSAPDDSLRKKIVQFLERWETWRELVRHASLTQCLETALTQTHYEDLLLAGERGAARVANVRRLVELARRFDPLQREGLFRFLKFVEEQQDAEVEHEPAVLNHENAVRLMTIHASKGLEFPVVVLAGTGTRFNLRDLYGDILLNERFGLCPKILATETRRRYPSIAHWAAAQSERRAQLGEEMRLLYVALTRARDTLILTGTASKKDEIPRWQQASPITDHALVRAGCYLDWLRLWFGNAVSPADWTSDCEGANELLRWKFFGPREQIFRLVRDEKSESENKIIVPDVREIAGLEQVFRFQYAHAAATLEPAKTSASALRRRTRDLDDEAAPLFPSLRVLSRSRAGGKLDATEVGTAHHLFLQFVSLPSTSSELDLRNEAARLVEANVLSQEQMEALRFDELAGFWLSELGQRLRQLPEEVVHREMPFTARLNAEDFSSLNLPAANLSAEDFVVVQGYADLAVLLPNEIWLVDFKTDDVSANGVAEKVKIYEPQLKLYGLALERIYRRPVRESWLYFLSAKRGVKIEPRAMSVTTANSRQLNLFGFEG